MKIDKRKAIILLTPVVKTMLKNEIIISNIYDANHAKEFASNVVEYMEDMEDTIDESKSKRMKLKSLLEVEGVNAARTFAAEGLLKILQDSDFKNKLNTLKSNLPGGKYNRIQTIYTELLKELDYYTF